MSSDSGSADPWRAVARHSPLAILSDLDGTLVPFANRPDDTVVGADLLGLLDALAALPGVSLAIVSGRTRESLDDLFRDAPGIWLAAENGGWHRAEGAWYASLATTAPDAAALDPLTAAFERIAAQYDKAWVERKTWSVCLHYRNVRRRERTGVLVQANAAFEAFAASHPGYGRVEASQAF
jgi:trehalose-phosphatase